MLREVESSSDAKAAVELVEEMDWPPFARKILVSWSVKGLRL
jgi:hypothetical protein